MVNDDYAFYETGALASAAASGNSWAGASHWKFVGIKKKVGAGGGGVGKGGSCFIRGGEINGKG